MEEKVRFHHKVFRCLTLNKDLDFYSIHEINRHDGRQVKQYVAGEGK
jgi:hypothetical protein